MAAARRSATVGDVHAEPLPKQEFGPLQLLTIAFDGSRFKGEIMPELERLKDGGLSRVVDMLAVRKDLSGATAVLTASDLEWLEATEVGAYIGTIVGYGAGARTVPTAARSRGRPSSPTAISSTTATRSAWRRSSRRG